MHSLLRLAAAALVAALAFASPALARPGLDARIEADGVTVLENEKPVFFYRTKPADPQTEPGRANYISPLYAPDGAVLTEDRPADHLHQRGVFWAWHQVLVNGQLVADGWFMKDLTYVVSATNFDGRMDGSAVLTLNVDWIVSSGPEVVYVATEVTKVHIRPLAKGARRLEFETVITPKVDGFALAGSDDAKGYGGFSIRLIRPDRLRFASAGKAVTPKVEPVQAGNAMGFAWPAEAGLPAWGVGLACKARGKAITSWVLRNELSMQNCAFPGRAPYAVAKGKTLKLEATLVIRPRAS